MKNNPLQKLIQAIPSHFYSGSSSFKIKGTLIEKKGDTIKLNIGGDKILEATMKESIDGKVGETIVIDKKDILNSKLYTQEKELQEKPQLDEEVDEGEEILRNWNLPNTEENQRALKALGKYGVELSKEKLLDFIASKTSLEKVISGLDYETAVKLLEKNIDLQETSIQEVALKIEEVHKEKENFSFINLFTKKNSITFQEAEKKALEIYGSKMGRDIIEVIQALYKAGLAVTRSNVERINNIFNKLDNLQNLEEATIIDALKNKIESSIDNLYKLKNAVTKNVILGEEKLSQLAIKSYEALSYQPKIITSKELDRMEENIKEVIKNFDLDITKNRVEIAKELIKKGLEVSKNNIQRVEEVQFALKELKTSLNYEKTAQAIKEGIQVEKKDVVALVKDLKTVYSKDTFRLEGIDKNIKGIDQQDFKDLEKLKGLMGNIRNIAHGNREGLLSLLIKNSVPVNIHEVYNLRMFLNNKQQITLPMERILQVLKEEDSKELKEIERNIREFLKETSSNLKSGRLDIEKTYQQLGKYLKEVEDKLQLLGEEKRGVLQRNSEILRESLRTQIGLNRQDTVFQLPVMMGNEFKNLQIYVMNKKKNTKKIDPNDMTLLLNFETNNMGNINIYTSVNYKKVTMRVGVKSLKDKNLFESNKREIEKLLETLGYQLKEMTFRIEEEGDLITMLEKNTDFFGWKKNFLDIKI